MWETAREFLLRFTGVFTRRRRERELEEELEFHLAQKRVKYEGGGAGSTEAAQRAHRDLGGLERWKERCRNGLTVRPLEDLGRDARLGFRALRKSPTFTLIAITTLAVAIGANTTVFSLINSMLLRTVDVPHPEQMTLLRILPGNFGYVFNYPWFKRIEKESSGVMEVFAFTSTKLRLKKSDGVEELRGQFVSGGYFPALQVKPALGRYIMPQDDRPGTPGGQVAVLSHAFWQSHFGADTKVLGRKLILSSTVFTIVGIMPERFRGMNHDERPSVFIPLESEPLVDAPFNNIAGGYEIWWMQVGARLKRQVSLQRASAYLKTSSHQLTHGKEMPAQFNFNGYSLDQLYLDAEPGVAGYSYIRLRFAKPLVVLMGLVGLVLLVACLNLASLLIARAAARQREISTRFALGASRFRLVRQLLMECLLLSLAGAVISLPASLLLTRTLASLIAPQHGTGGTQIDTAPDGLVFAFTAGVTVLATMVAGVAPALRSTEYGVQTGLREGSVTLRAVERRRFWPRVFLALEIALALVVVTGASLLGYSFLKLSSVPLGFNPEGLIHLTVDTSGPQFHPSSLPEIYRELTERLKSLPGVKSISIGLFTPLAGSSTGLELGVPGKSHQPVSANMVGPAYFQTMGTALREGREFRWTDANDKKGVVILNAAAERAFFPHEHALGRYVTKDSGKSLLEVVGVVENTKYSTVRDETPPMVYFTTMSAMTDKSPSPSVELLLRSEGPVAPLIAAATKIIYQKLPEIPLPAAISMTDTLNESIASERILTMLAAFFGVLALGITGIGLYGTLAYMTERRTGEIGIRIALGAQRWNIASLVCRENGVIAFAGCAIGLLASLAASKLVASFLYGITPRDPMAFGAAVIALLSAAVVASLFPALRATRIDPMTAIRHE